MMPEIEAHRADIEEICRRFGVARLFVFGSAATGRMHSESDVDFLIEFSLEDHFGYAARYFGFLEAVEELFGRKVDLVVDSAIRNPYFRQAVDETKVSLYAA